VDNEERRVRSRLVDIAGSVLTTLLVFAAVPIVLLTLVGYPLAGGLGHQWGHAARVAMTVLTIVAWVAWLACCAQLTRAVIHHVRRGHVGVAIGAPLTERIAARIAIGILAVTTMGAPIIVAGTSSGASPTVAARAPAALVVRDLSTVVAPTTSSAASYVVRPGDSLWTIADAHYDDGGDWTAIAALNVGRTMPDGRQFVDPSLIDVGWVLVMPATGGAVATTADVIAPTVVAPGPAPSAGPTPTTTPTTLPVSTPQVPASVPPTSVPPTSVPPTSVPTTAVVAPAAATTPAPQLQHGASGLPELVVLGMGTVACAALARRSRRRRLLQQFGPSSSAPPTPSEPAVDLDVLLQRFSDVPAFTAVERANCRLGLELSASTQRSAQSIRAICVNASGVDFWLATPNLTPPPGFDLVKDGEAWRISHPALDGLAVAEPFFPIVLSIGDDDDGSWLVPLRPGMSLPIMGPGGEHLWRAARRVQEAWSWADMVFVTEDPVVAAREAQRYSSTETSHDDFPILFFGDPARLSAATLPLVSVVTISPTAAATDLSVLVDQHGASIHPLARTVRPHAVTARAARLLDELVDPPRVEASDAEPDESPPAEPEALAVLQTDTAPDLDALGPGLVEVRLLTMTPRLDGLREELPPNRERRAVELIAYLALHRPDTVTSDRLRTRVLGSGDADAAAKTLFNIATAARRAMGADDLGQPLFPAGTRTGHYRVSDEVTVDVQRAAALASVGNALEDPNLAIAHLRAALDLIEGEPLANALSGYTWWESEGHGGRLAAVLVNAACNLAALCVDAGLFDLAQWGLDRARLVDPYSESLSRAAMQVAAAGGDADRLRREWRECQRRVDELDPGSSPSPRTERLYGELAQQVLAS
jgi:DNA-binding SARP family transcriptional activator/LysM repeat protein